MMKSVNQTINLESMHFSKIKSKINRKIFLKTVDYLETDKYGVWDSGIDVIGNRLPLIRC